jgi:alpha-1,2-mannosyltransferase
MSATIKPAQPVRPVSPSRQLSPPGLTGLLRRPAARWARVALVLVNLAVIAAFLLSYSRHGVGFGLYRIDLAAYRMGGQSWLHGEGLYGQAPVSRGLSLPFTYPPIAAALLAPLAVMAMTPAGTVLTLGSIALAALVLWVFLRRLALPGDRPGEAGDGRAEAAKGSVWTVGWLLPAALLLEPVRSTLAYGQVNLALMTLVTLDCLVVAPRWPRGALTGLAAAVKLTPAAFVLFFLLRRDYRAAATAGVSFAAASAAGFAFAWPDSVRYWTVAVFQPGRVGDPAHAANQCLQAVLARAGLPPHTAPGLAVWLGLAALVAVLTCRGMRRALAVSQDCVALSLNAFAALLISPMSWSHHWVWCVPALLTLADLGRRYRLGPAMAAAVCGLVIFAVAPQWWLGRFAGPELRWAAWQQALGNGYVIFAVIVLLLAARDQLTAPFPAVRSSP